MKIQNIKVGTKYHDSWTGNILLGVGRRKLFTENEFISKHLVVIESEHEGHIGMIIHEREDASEGYWDGIEEL